MKIKFCFASICIFLGTDTVTVMAVCDLHDSRKDQIKYQAFKYVA